MQQDDQREILIVVGAHLDAERQDRFTAYALKRELDASVEARRIDARGVGSAVLVCTDLWYLNHDALRSRPTVSLGGPHLNALTAFLADKLPSPMAIDGTSVQVDLDAQSPLAAIWGASSEATSDAAARFVERHAEAFLDAALR